MAHEKLCIFCKHCEMEHSAMGSTWTGAYGADGLTCHKGHYSEYDEQPRTIRDFRTFVLRAEECPDYEADK